MTAAITILAAVSWLALLARALLVGARMQQIEEYDGRRLLTWAAQPGWAAHPAALAAGGITFAGAVAAATTSSGSTGLAGGWLVGSLAGHLLWRWLPAKKALVLTARMRRLLAAVAVGALALVVALVLAVLDLSLSLAPAPLCAAVLGTPLLAVALLTGGNLVMVPVEERVRRHYLDRASRRLAEVDPLVIAVAGSWGKTTTKHILAHLLGAHGITLPTRKSFNTLMGVCRVINEDLRPEHRTFIVEMDAYAPGEIAALCALVRPRHAVVTAVGSQHLERFGSLARIADSINEVIEALPPHGIAVVQAGDPESAALAQRALAAGRMVVRYALAGDGAAAALDVVAEDVSITGGYTAFTWCWPARGLAHRLEVPLLGRHQALNVTAALAMVEALGLELAPALAAVATLEPVEHRLQPVPTANEVTVIDDSYNANPVGVHNGLEVLAAMAAGQRILVTPGLVELGPLEDEENRRYGAHAARVCDHVIVMDAPPGQAFQQGLRDGGMAETAIHVVHSLGEATAVIARLARAGDVVLFANDLPDTYLGGG